MAKDKVKYTNIICAVPINQSAQLKRSNAQHFRLMKKTNNSDMKWYHRNVLNMQNVKQRVLSRKEKGKIFELSKRKNKPYINYFEE